MGRKRFEASNSKLETQTNLRLFVTADFYYTGVAIKGASRPREGIIPPELFVVRTSTSLLPVSGHGAIKKEE